MTYDIEGQPPTSVQINRERRKAQKTLTTATALKILLYLSATAATAAVIIFKPAFPFTLLSIDITMHYVKMLSIPAYLAAIGLATFLTAEMISLIEENANNALESVEQLPEQLWEQKQQFCREQPACQKYNLAIIKQKRPITSGEFFAMKKLAETPQGPIKELTEMYRPSIIWPYAALMMPTAIIYALASQPNTSFKIFLTLVCLLVLVPLFLKERHAKQIQTKNYDNYLPTVPLQILTAAAISPELEASSREAITTYLNTMHPGWSFATADEKNTDADHTDNTLSAKQTTTKPLRELNEVATLKLQKTAIYSIVAILSAAALVYQFFSPAPPLLVAAETLAFQSFTYAALTELHFARRHQQRDYEHYLQLNATQELLERATTSPELTKPSRKAITLFLNKQQKGWSFKHAPTLDITAPLHKI